MITYKLKPKNSAEVSIYLLDEDQTLKFQHENCTQVNEVISSKQFTGTLYDIFPIVNKGTLILLVGLGKREELTLTIVRIAAKKALESKYLKGKKDIALYPHSQKEECILAIIEGIKIGTYRWKKYLTESSANSIDAMSIQMITPQKKSFEIAEDICAGVNATRDLVNDNADFVTSTHFEKEIRAIAKGQKNISLEILNEKELNAKGLNLHLAVNQGSNKQPKLIIAKYTGNPKDKKLLAIVGKGITFDSGGLNLKPTSHIETMREDMAGAGAVLGVLKNLIKLKIKKNVVCVLGIAENAIGSGSYKPGDVIKSYSGKTVEICNTDAEGRLVLADAISYVIKNYKPEKLVDIATLTGACVVALGYDYTALISTSEQMAKDILSSADKTDDRAWRLPIYPELKSAIKSKIADIKNIGLPKGAAGTLTAAEFLRQFTGETLWAHLDIAGTSFVESSERMYFNYGATGSSVRLLTHFIQNYA